MPRKSKLDLPQLDLGQETLGQRIARLRVERGLSQAELGKKMGLTPGLISDYERERIRPYPEMTVRFAMAYDISTDELLGIKSSKIKDGYKPSPKILRRLKKIEELPSSQQKFLLRAVDTIIKGIEK